MVAALAEGKLSYRQGTNAEHLFISGGFAEVRGNTVRVLTGAGETPSEIDIERARSAEERARARLKPRETGLTAGEAQIDLARASAALRRALARLKLKGYAG
jgi:F-type H+-transporting ATPase subunit epsilon